MPAFIYTPHQLSLLSVIRLCATVARGSQAAVSAFGFKLKQAFKPTQNNHFQAKILIESCRISPSIPDALLQHCVDLCLVHAGMKLSSRASLLHPQNWSMLISCVICLFRMCVSASVQLDVWRYACIALIQSGCPVTQQDGLMQCPGTQAIGVAKSQNAGPNTRDLS